ncbi:hypothetical protein PG997_015131 [Apiospora hydei]|uniref:C2H2-type domain-containing protein n=1 Tax=Apiospora hydei TaxID=1337664 RepID=A0ABR1UYY2_9PEZI
MASLQPTSNVTGSSTNTAANNTHVCQTCNKVLGSAKTLDQHTRTHNKQHRCGHCGELFARYDQVRVHAHTKHGRNISYFICYMEGCTRKGLGLETKDSLIRHLEGTHQGATLADNELAAAHSNIKLIGESSSEEESDAEDVAKAEAVEQLTEASDDEGQTSDSDPENMHDEYDQQIKQLQDQIAEERAERAKEIEDLHEFYQSKIQDLEDRLNMEKRHRQTHQKQHKCGVCDERFARLDQVEDGVIATYEGAEDHLDNAIDISSEFNSDTKSDSNNDEASKEDIIRLGPALAYL